MVGRTRKNEDFPIFPFQKHCCCSYMLMTCNCTKITLFADITPNSGSSVKHELHLYLDNLNGVHSWIIQARLIWTQIKINRHNWLPKHWFVQRRYMLSKSSPYSICRNHYWWKFKFQWIYEEFTTKNHTKHTNFNFSKKLVPKINSYSNLKLIFNE